MTRQELTTRLLLRISDPRFASEVRASNAGMASSPAEAVDAGRLHEAASADAFLTQARELFGDLGFVLEERLRGAFTGGAPRRALVYIAASHALAAARRPLRVSGVWTPRSVAELLAIDAEEFASALYRTLLWRDPSAHERAGIATALAAGAGRRELIAAVASLPAARDTPVPVEGIVDLDAIVHECDDGEFVDRLYTVLLARTPDVAGARDWRAALRGGVRRDELLRRFIEQIAPTFPHRVYIGMPRARGAS